MDAAIMVYQLTDDEKWSAVTACDRRFNGLFFYGVTTTGVFCRPSCTARTPLRKNVRFFQEISEALDAGFRPCRKCRPDLRHFEPGRELVEKAKEGMALRVDLSEIPASRESLTALSDNSLRRLFRKYEGCSPGRYEAALRIEKAKDLLAETDMSVLNISLHCGFESLSNFYRQFREHTGTVPRKFRTCEPGETPFMKEDNQ